MHGSKKICLFLVPIDELEIKIREWYEQVYEHIVKPAAKVCGYEAERSDQLPGTSEPISQKVFRHLRQDAMVVADLTWLPPGVFYELGFRRARGKPAIQLIRRGDSAPFDVRHFPTIEVELTQDGTKKGKAELAKKIRETEKEVSSKTRKIKKKVPRAKPF